MTPGAGSFPRQARLLDKKDYGRVFSNAGKVGNTAFTLLCRENELDRPRLGLAISKKALPRAVDRNLVKRVVRESFRANQQSLGGRDFVVMARRGVKPAQREDLRRAIDALWKKSCGRCTPAR